MKKGDIILVHSRFDPVAWLIRKATHSYWNHVAICIDNNNLLEVRGRCISISSCRKYIYNDKFYDYKIVRLKNISTKNIRKAVDYMIEINEKGYFKWLRACLMSFFDSKRVFPRRTCSGLIAEAFHTVGFDFRRDKLPHKITPADIDNNSKTMNITGKELYRVR